LPVATDLAAQHAQGKVEQRKIDNEISAAQISALYQHMPMVLAVNVVNAGLVALVLASYMEQTRWWIFFGLVVSLTGVRAAGWRWYRNYRKSVEAKTIWTTFATVGSGLSGLLWGAGSTLLLPDNIVEQTFLAFVIGGMCAGALVSLSYYLPAFIAYVYASGLPLAITFLLDGRTVYIAMGCMALVFVAAVTFAARHFNRQFVGGVRLNLVLGERTEQLTMQTEELTAANSRLEAEIAQRKVAEDQLHQAQKMEALGQLTGGIAHDFNNLLTAVIGNLELAARRPGSDPQMSNLLQAALSAAERGAGLVRDLLAFARRQPLMPKQVNVPAAVDDVLQILKQTIGSEIHIITHVEPNLRPAWVDPTQLELAILNLALNARDAMPGGGRLRISSESRRAEPGIAPSDLATEDFVVVTVSDTGTGMSEATLAHAFEPFFTTKEPGQGSGLGLSMVQGFAAQSGGGVQIVSSLGEGTHVALWLPCAQGRSTARVSLEPGGAAVRPS
jgi:signal transduction histidine kinase